MHHRRFSAAMSTTAHHRLRQRTPALARLQPTVTL
jgi:hypothetical protein